MKIKVVLKYSWKLVKTQTAGIRPDSMQTTEQGDKTEQEQKSVRQILRSAYENNISTRLRAELCSVDVNNYNYTKNASTSKFPQLYSN